MFELKLQFVMNVAFRLNFRLKIQLMKKIAQSLNVRAVKTSVILTDTHGVILTPKYETGRNRLGKTKTVQRSDVASQITHQK